jgi:hypothetical protein
LIVIAAVLFVASFLLEKLPAAARTLLERSEVLMPDSSEGPPLPVHWDEEQIRSVARRYQEQPTVVRHYIDSVRRRFVYNQNQQTAQARIKFLGTVIEELKLAKEYQEACDDLSLHDLEREIRLLELELKRNDLRDRAGKEQQLRDLRHELEIARLQQDIEKIRIPPSPPASKPTNQQRRERAWEERGRILQERDEKLGAIKKGRSWDELSPAEQEGCKRVQNIYEDAVRRQDEEIAKHL